LSDGGGLAVGGRWAVSGERPGTVGKSRWPGAVPRNRHLPQSALGSKTPLAGEEGLAQDEGGLFGKQPCYGKGCDS